MRQRVELEVRESGDPNAAYAVKGYAAVFNSKSLDLGGFFEVVDPAAFDDVLSRAPDVHLLWDHDTSLTLARTKNKTLRLGTDATGLEFYAKVAPTSYAADLRILMEGDYVDQCSFAFTVAEDSWDVVDTPDGVIVLRTVLVVGELYDVTICALGAYPATSSEVTRSHVAKVVDAEADPARRAKLLQAIIRARPEEREAILAKEPRDVKLHLAVLEAPPKRTPAEAAADERIRLAAAKHRSAVNRARAHLQLYGETDGKTDTQLLEESHRIYASMPGNLFGPGAGKYTAAA